MSTRPEFWTFLVYIIMHLFVLLYLCWLKATNADIAIRKYPIGRTPFLKDEKLQFFEDTKNGPTIIILLLLALNFATTFPFMSG